MAKQNIVFKKKLKNLPNLQVIEQYNDETELCQGVLIKDEKEMNKILNSPDWIFSHFLTKQEYDFLNEDFVETSLLFQIAKNTFKNLTFKHFEE